PENRLNPGFELSNAAGFNKDGNIPPTFLKALGFDRVVVGTVTGDPWQGNPRPRIIRYSNTDSMVNWMGLPGVGAKAVAENLERYSDHHIPITINLMSTPGKTGNDLLEDLRETLLRTKYLHGVDRYELNISCPNTHSTTGKGDSRAEYQNQLARMLEMVNAAKSKQEVYLKVSPDLDKDSIKEIVRIAQEYKVIGFTTTNTTTQHKPNYIHHKPNPEGKGGASGNAVYDLSYATQQAFRDAINVGGYQLNLIACGGINSSERVKLRTICEKVNGVQIFTPLIFKGPSLLRELRKTERRRI
ncbi:MAG: hypothetical protein Q7R87_00855, partial [Nanoarchaeota archaeon]|nr:hypothetical protein [Nanoarchaeota archaeon]